MDVIEPGLIEERLLDLPGWEFDEDEIQKRFSFADFGGSMAFVNRIAEIAESVDHHPEMTIMYDQVKIELSTHSAGGVTEKDFDLAARIDAVAAA